MIERAVPRPAGRTFPEEDTFCAALDPAGKTVQTFAISALSPAGRTQRCVQKYFRKVLPAGRGTVRSIIKGETYSRQNKTGGPKEINSLRILEELLLDSLISPSDTIVRYVDNKISTRPGLNSFLASDSYELQKTVCCFDLPGTPLVSDTTYSPTFSHARAIIYTGSPY
ncbi:hypothetical protein J6590_033305 [Homalodisca vitripennis]|nr:hypothetical protein J6590_033305 [Homalodisca vitripennis]